MNPAAERPLTPDLNIASLVLKHPQLIIMLEHFNIFMPVSDKTIRNTCREHHVNPELFVAFAHLYLDGRNSSPANLEFDDVPAIIDFLTKSHIYYTGEMYPKLKTIIDEMYAHENQDEAAIVEKFFNDYFTEVREHLNYEDAVAFPYISGLYNHICDQKSLKKSTGYSVGEYKDHHNDIEEKLDDLKNLLVKFLPPKNDQQKRRTLFLHLNELDHDLSIHAVIEDTILIPLVEKMETHITRLKV